MKIIGEFITSGETHLVKIYVDDKKQFLYHWAINPGYVTSNSYLSNGIPVDDLKRITKLTKRYLREI